MEWIIDENREILGEAEAFCKGFLSVEVLSGEDVFRKTDPSRSESLEIVTIGEDHWVPIEIQDNPRAPEFAGDFNNCLVFIQNTATKKIILGRCKGIGYGQEAKNYSYVQIFYLH